MAEPDFRILVGNKGDNLKNGESANLIRTNLETALADGIKIKVTPDLSSTTNSSGASNISKAMSSLTSNAGYADKQLASLSVKFDTLKQKISAFSHADIKVTALDELQQQYDAIEKELTEYAKRSNDVTALEKENIKQRVASMSQLVSMFEKLDTAQSKTEGYVDFAKYRATSALGNLGSLDTAQAKEAVNIQQQLNEKLDQYVARKTEITAKEKAWVEEQISAIKRLSSEQEKMTANADKQLASQQMQLARLNEYLTTVDPRALTQFAGEINNIRQFLGSNIPVDAKAATAAITKLKAEIKAAGYEGGNVITYIQGKMQTFVTYLASSALTMGIVNGVKSVIDNVENLDDALTDLRIVTGATREETQELLKTYNQMAQQLGTTTTNVSSGATDWLRQGYSEEDARELLTQSMTLSIVGAMESADATDALTAALKGNHETSLCVQKCA